MLVEMKALVHCDHCWKREHRKYCPIRPEIRLNDKDYCFNGESKALSPFEAKETIQNIPNFDAKIFKEITGIDVKKKNTRESK